MNLLMEAEVLSHLHLTYPICPGLSLQAHTTPRPRAETTQHFML